MEKIRFNLFLDKNIKKELKSWCKYHDHTMSTTIERLIKEFLDKEQENI